MNDDNDRDIDQNIDQGNEDQVARSRRRFLKATTKLAVYTPPAMMAVSKPALGSNWNGSVNYRNSGGSGNRKKSSRRSKTSNSKRSSRKATWWHDPF